MSLDEKPVTLKFTRDYSGDQLSGNKMGKYATEERLGKFMSRVISFKLCVSEVNAKQSLH